MDLARLVLQGIEADKARKFLEALEELPDETIKGDSHPDKIQAFPDAYKQDGINLNVLYTPLEKPESIVFSVPSDSSESNSIKDVQTREEGIEFRYKEKFYRLRKVLLTY